MPDTATARALRKAGLKSTDERLAELADAALAGGFRTRDALRANFLDQVRNDAALLWTMFLPFHGVAADRLLDAARERQRRAVEARGKRSASGAIGGSSTTVAAPQRPGGENAAGPSLAAQEEARAYAMRVISKLDTFRIFNGKKPIGDCTPEEAAGWQSATRRELRFVSMISAGVPPGRPIRDFIRPDEAELLWQQAQREGGNE